jgi:hypothetical protein
MSVTEISIDDSRCGWRMDVRISVSFLSLFLSLSPPLSFSLYQSNSENILSALGL